MYHSPVTVEAQMNKNFRKVFDGKAPTVNTLLHAQNSCEGARLTFGDNLWRSFQLAFDIWFRFGTALSYIYNVIAEFRSLAWRECLTYGTVRTSQFL